MRICQIALGICLLVLIILLIRGILKKKEDTPQLSVPTEQTETVLEDLTSEETEVTELVVEETHEGQARSLYTGLWIDEELASVRPVALMIENTKSALPQYGLAQADVIYECPVEGGITRLMAIMQDYTGMERIGNIRSSRNYYVYFAREFDAVYFHCGKSHFAESLLASDFIDNVDGTTGKAASYYYRTSDKSAPHNLYTSSAMISSAISAYGYSSVLSDTAESHYQFAEDNEPVTLSDGTDAVKVSLYYSNNKPYFVYQEEDGLYYRYQFSSAQTDAITGEQLTAKNIIIQVCDWYLWEESTGYLYIEYMGSGTGKYITNGKCIDITWTRESESGKTRYYDTDGNEIVLNQGVTWVEIAQDTYAGNITISGE